MAAIPQTFDLAGEATRRLDFTFPETLARGDYLVTGLVRAQGGEAQAFADPLTVGIPVPILSYIVAPEGVVHPGELLTHTISFTNTSGLPLSNVLITASLPLSLTLVSGSITGGGALQGDDVRWELGNIAAGATVTLGFQAEAGDVPFTLAAFPVDSQVYFTATETGVSVASARALLSRCGVLSGDVDCSWAVDVQDVMAVENHWRALVGTPEYELYLDLNEDGVINVVDIMTVAAQWGRHYR